MVAVPPVVGLSLADAKELLERNDLKYQVVERPDGTVPPNTVVAVEPRPGTSVPVGGTVKLYVAVPPSPSPTARPTSARPTVTSTN
jgi:beta-lactam-binding protein with PASTA domain